MTQLQAGEKRKFSEVGLSSPLTVTVKHGLDGLDISAFGLSADRKMVGDNYIAFYNNPHTPLGEIVATLDAHQASFKMDLAKLPANVERVMLTATHDTAPVASAPQLLIEVGQVSFDAKPALKSEKAAMLLELYKHSGEWRVGAIGQGFNGGLGDLIVYFGGEVENPGAPVTAPSSPVVSLKKQTQVKLDKEIAEKAPQLVNLVKQAEISLKKRGLDEHTARVALVLDISASMSSLYRSGVVQRVAEKTLALASRFDDDGRMDVFLFGLKAHDAGDIGIEGIGGAVEKLIKRHPLEGGTMYARAVQSVRTHYFGSAGPRKEPLKEKTPVYVIFITDGETFDKKESEAQIKEASKEPIFWKFVGVGKERFEFLRKLDDLSGRFIDNADFVQVEDIDTLPDGQLYEMLLQEYDSFLNNAKSKGLLS
ncbi:VWA domain-containing protein [Deinococcus psychrotolerans]|uniref:VWA domain-containing protein n=1 Tax=Deinococcus psychrotolerans TaxID=2489213 RepID=A0A3G8YDY2_9DEIO|nr:VWA domain-containing protein [Deinococcus psychrotolerans]AZI43185.1 VWA domain-containing protein [Deinococcus psychrotolerans]